MRQITMNRLEFFAALKAKLQSLSGVPLDDFTSDDRLFSSGLVDSLNIVEIIQFVESYFDIQVDPTDLSMDNFDSMTSVAGYVESKLSGKT